MHTVTTLTQSVYRVGECKEIGSMVMKFKLLHNHTLVPFEPMFARYLLMPWKLILQSKHLLIN